VFNTADLYVQMPYGQQYGESGGNGVSAESGSELPLTTISPGQAVTGTLTINAPVQHARVVHAPGKALDTWMF
jgi:hypothetical protein